jgi:hypothetical protein
VIKVKYGAVIGSKKTHSLEIVTGHIQKFAFLGQSQRRISPLYHQTTEFHQTTVYKLQWLTPPTKP